MNRVYLDVESCGLHGQPVLLQYAIENQPVQLYEPWREPIGKTLELIRWLCEQCIVGFNLAFDWFMINKVYNTFLLLNDEDALPVNHIDELAIVEEKARDGFCLKPASALDLMLYARKTHLQVTMDRSDIVVRRVPADLADDLARLLNEKIRLDPILFAGRKKYAPHFQVRDIIQSDGEPHPQLKNIVLKFRPSSALKSIAKHVLNAKVIQFAEVELEKIHRPKEYGYAPYALAVGKPGNWNGAWPEKIETHIWHWKNNDLARKYATDDVEHTRSLDKHWDYPTPGDDDSILSCAVAACRWKGFKLDLEKLKALIQKYNDALKYPIAPNRVKAYIGELLDPIERIRLEESTKKIVLKEIAGWKDKPEAAQRAQNVLDARTAKKKKEILEKLLKAGRFHASFKVIGALSGRMSGADGLNAQGIDKTKEVRGSFPLAFDDEDLLGGDMQSFEISIADADYNDPKLREQLLTCEKCTIIVNINDKGVKICPKCGGSETKSFHGLFALGFWPHMTYEEVLATKGTPNPIYNYAKNAAFATLYGAQAMKLMATLNIDDEDLVQQGLLRFWRTYAVAGNKRRQTEYDFAALYSERVGGRIKYKEPKEAIDSLLGFRRYFTLENYLIKCLFDIAENPPKPWLQKSKKIVRSKRGEQTIGGAIRSALYGAAFATQNSNIRQAANHRIQSTGAGITKRIQCAIWEFQPSGVHKWMVRPINIHDEIQCPTDPSIVDRVTERVYSEVEKFRPLIPLIGIDFGKLESWADK